VNMIVTHPYVMMQNTVLWLQWCLPEKRKGTYIVHTIHKKTQRKP